MSNPNLTALTKQRQDHVESLRKNKDRSHETIAGMYSERSHCIYELLQNADDAEATEVTFTLHPDTLEFQHNGKEFSFADVASITTIGHSTKADDVKKIGKFGAGFKSVFAITNSPEIFSGNFNFRVTDFIVPEEIEQPESLASNETRIRLPLNDNAHDSLRDGLNSLHAESLLFLRNINTIQSEGAVNRHYSLTASTNDVTQLFVDINGESNTTNYLHFDKHIRIGETELTISVAYLLNDNCKSIAEIEPADLFVFFPTKENTGLHFLTHAPYKTTPNRETIPFGEEENKEITQQLANLIAESICQIKNKGMLDVAFLSLLPLGSNNASQIHMAASEAVKSVLSTESFLPTKTSGKYAKAKDALLARGKALTDLLDSNDCAQLFERSNWLDTEITADKHRELHSYLIHELDIPEIAMEDFCNKLNQEFVAQKSDDWLISFYANVTNNDALYRKSHNPIYADGMLRTIPIIRLQDDSHACPDNEDGDVQVYLPAENIESNFDIVKDSIVEAPNALEFLQRLGIEKPDSVDEVKKLVAENYQKPASVTEQKYRADFARVNIWWQGADDDNKLKIINILRHADFIGCVDKNDAFCLRKPDEVYHRTEKLLQWFKGNDQDDFYFITEYLQDSQYKEFVDALPVCKRQNTESSDFSIEGLEFVLNNIDFAKSIAVFNLVLQYAIELSGNPYLAKQDSKTKAGNLLSATHWLYGKDGILLKKPLEEIAVDDLHDRYAKTHPYIDRLVKSLGLKPDQVRQIEQKTGGKFIPPEEVPKYEKWKASQELTEAPPKEPKAWEADVSPDEAYLPNKIYLQQESEQPNVPGPSPPEPGTTPKPREPDGEEPTEPNTPSDRDRKAIGRWGELWAHRYLAETKYPDAKVDWTNKNGDIGEGRDFEVKKGETTLYYEIKSTAGGIPSWIEITGKQWELAAQLHAKNQGDMYRILVLFNVGTENPDIAAEIHDPVGKWKQGKLRAHPVKIQLPK